MGSSQVPRPLRIALVTSSYAPHVGGVEEHVRHVARELRGQGEEVEVWAVDRGSGPVAREIDGVTVRYLPTPLPSRSMGGILRFLLSVAPAWRRWALAQKAFRPDLLHVHCFGPNGLYALAVHRRWRSPMVVTSHGETVADDGAVFDRSALIRYGLRRALSAAAVVTAPSEFVLSDLRRRFGLVGGEVVPNGVDPEPRGDASRAPVAGPYLLGVGRLGRMKGFDLLVEAFARLDAAELTLLIVGDGSERERLGTLAVELGVAERVVFAGRLDARRVADAMAAAIAVVVPSRVEAFGIVALEAWRSGAPLVMTNRGGASGFVRDAVDGVLIDPTDVDTLGDALARVMGDPDFRSRLSEAGSARVAEFSWDRTARAYTRIYCAVIRQEP